MPRSHAKGGGAEIGPTGRGKGVKIVAVDRRGLPLAVTTHAGHHHQVTLVQLTFDFYMIEARPHARPLQLNAKPPKDQCIPHRLRPRPP
jgi:hypothetical protein